MHNYKRKIFIPPFITNLKCPEFSGPEHLLFTKRRELHIFVYVLKNNKKSEENIFRSKDLEALGYSRPGIRVAVEQGEFEQISRGLYRRTNADTTEHHSLAIITKRIPTANICLISALNFHGLTTQLPHQVWIAIGNKDRHPKLDYPAIRVQRFSTKALEAGIETHLIEGIEVKVYSVAKTIVDLFRYRNKIGLDIALEALREGWNEKRFTMNELNRLAKLCRMQKVMTPYLESLVG